MNEALYLSGTLVEMLLPFFPMFSELLLEENWNFQVFFVCSTLGKSLYELLKVDVKFLCI